VDGRGPWDAGGSDDQHGNAQEATVKRILHHTAGLPMHWNFFFDGESFARPTMDETIKRFGILVAPPGDRYEYSNLGYGILEYIIERISKKRLATFQILLLLPRSRKNNLLLLLND